MLFSGLGSLIAHNLNYYITQKNILQTIFFHNALKILRTFLCGGLIHYSTTTILIMLLMLSPSFPNAVEGIPAVTTTTSPIEINSLNFAMQIASLQISSVVTQGTDFKG